MNQGLPLGGWSKRAKWVLGFLNPELYKLWQSRTPPSVLSTGTLGRCSTPQEAGPETKRDEGPLCGLHSILANSTVQHLKMHAPSSAYRGANRRFLVVPNPSCAQSARGDPSNSLVCLIGCPWTLALPNIAQIYFFAYAELRASLERPDFGMHRHDWAICHQGLYFSLMSPSQSFSSSRASSSGVLVCPCIFQITETNHGDLGAI